MALFAVIVAFALGLAIAIPCCAPSLRIANSPLPRRVAELLFAASMAFPLGAGMLSALHFALLPARAANAWVVLLLGLAIAGTLWYISRKSPAENSLVPPLGEPGCAPFSLRWALAIAAGGALIAVLASMGQILGKSPFGGWDSWAIWTVRGKFLAAGEPFWKNAIDAGFRLSHPEYPLMTPSFLAWGWKLTGDSALLPHATAIAYLLSAIGVTTGLVAILRGASQSLLTLVALLSPVVVVTVSASLYADLPLAAILSCASALLVLSFHAPRPFTYLALTGAFASLCAWTKAEGMIHLGVIALVVLAACAFQLSDRGAAWRRVAAFVAGAVPVTLLVVLFKWLMVPTGIGASGDTGAESWLTHALSFSRYAETLRGAASVVANMGSFGFHPVLFLILALVLLGVNRKTTSTLPFRAAAAAWLLISGGYLSIYILLATAPYALIMNSLDRLFLHLWPPLVTLVFLAAKSPEDWAVLEQHRGSRKHHKQEPASDTPIAVRSRKRKGGTLP